VVLLVGGFYLLREQASPGYWSAVFAEELGGRYLHGMKNHTHPPYYYLWALITLFALGPLVLALLAAPALRWRRTPSAAFFTYGAYVSVAMLAVLSVSQTKIFWYLVPLYPILAIMLAITFERGLQRLAGGRRPLIDSPHLITAGLGMAAFAAALFIKIAWLPGIEDQPQGRYGEVFAALHKAGVRHIRAVDAGVTNDDDLVDYTPQLHLYAMAWRQRGMNVRFGAPDGMAAVGLGGEVVVTCDPRYLDAVNELGPSLTTVKDCAAARR
jgi:hypothetical protein